jgi:hypothetical protein
VMVTAIVKTADAVAAVTKFLWIEKPPAGGFSV